MALLSPINSKIVSADYTLTYGDWQNIARVVVTAPGVRVTTPIPRRDLALSTNGIDIQNGSTGQVFVQGHNAFACGKEVLVLEPGHKVHLSAAPDGNSGYYFDTDGYCPDTSSKSFTPVLTWTTATPTPVTKEGRVKYANGIGLIDIRISVASGAGATDLKIKLPEGIIPDDVDCEFVLTGYEKVGTVRSRPLPYVDCANGTIANRVIGFRKFAVATGGSALEIHVHGWFEPYRTMQTYSPVVADTGSGATFATVGRYKIIDLGSQQWCIGVVHITTGDGKGDSAVTVTPPVTSEISDVIWPCEAQIYIESNSPTWIEGVVGLLLNASAPGDRLFADLQGTTFVNAKDAQITFSFCYPVSGALSREYVTDHPTDITWGTDFPTLSKGVCYYGVGNGICMGAIVLMSTDGNDAGTFTMRPPVPPRYSATLDMPLSSMELVDTTMSAPGAYLACNQVVPANRTIRFTDFTVATAHANFGVTIPLLYEVA